jgi:4-amino-4-deoxy-L-arabinose transferase-like glycosyltransferase
MHQFFTNIPRVYFFLALLALLAGFLMIYATPQGLALENDSTAYIAGARSLMMGLGYSDIWLDSELEPITHYPPLLSAILAVAGWLTGLDPMRGMRALNILLFAANTGLLGIIGYRLTGKPWAALLLSVLFMLNPLLFRVNMAAMSEPLFIFLSLAAFLALDIALKLENHRLFAGIALAGFLAGMAFLARYSALALVATLAVSIFLFTAGWKDRLLRLLFFFAGVVPPILAWMIRNALVAENYTNRAMVYHPIREDVIVDGWQNVATFLLPGSDWALAFAQSGAIVFIGGIVLVICLIWLAWQAWRLFFVSPNSTQFLLFGALLYLLGYLLSIVVSMTFFDAATKFVPRILAPAFISLQVAFVVCLAALEKQLPGIWVKRTFLVLLMGLVLVPSLIGLTSAMSAYRVDGQGYASTDWRFRLMMEVRNLPPETAIYTNSPPAIYLIHARASRVIPTPVDSATTLERDHYQDSLDEMNTEILAGRAVLVLLHPSAYELKAIETVLPNFKLLDEQRWEEWTFSAIYGKP